MYSAQNGHELCVKALIDAKANFEMQTEKGSVRRQKKSDHLGPPH